MSKEAIIDEIFARFAQYGHLSYGEDVSVLTHSLQTAYFAERDGASETLIVSALLHDYGHLLHDESEDIADRGIDTIHEELGAQALAAYLGPEVTEPIRLHVAAKRYLCATDSDYYKGLSQASKQSLALQSGPFMPDEVAAFEAKPFVKDAVQLRRYDDIGKEPFLEVPGLEHYRPLLVRVLHSS